jgi:hypothetical protein
LINLDNGVISYDLSANPSAIDEEGGENSESDKPSSIFVLDFFVDICCGLLSFFYETKTISDNA